MAQAARVLGMQRPNLYRKVRQLAVVRKGASPEAAPSRTVRNTISRPVNADKDSMEIR